jgi:hypothetical protein
MLNLEIGRWYLRNDGREVCIKGLAKREPIEGMTVFWANTGEHYTADGRDVFPDRLAPPTSSRSLVREMRTKVVTVHSSTLMAFLVTQLCEASQWFSYHALPDDVSELTIKAEEFDRARQLLLTQPLDFATWYDLEGDELTIKAAETGADRELDYNSEDYAEAQWTKWLESLPPVAPAPEPEPEPPAYPTTTHHILTLPAHKEPIKVVLVWRLETEIDAGDLLRESLCYAQAERIVLRGFQEFRDRALNCTMRAWFAFKEDPERPDSRENHYGWVARPGELPAHPLTWRANTLNEICVSMRYRSDQYTFDCDAPAGCRVYMREHLQPPIAEIDATLLRRALIQKTIADSWKKMEAMVTSYREKLRQVEQLSAEQTRPPAAQSVPDC